MTNKKQISPPFMTSLLRGIHQKEGFCDRGTSGAEVQVLHVNVSVSKALSESNLLPWPLVPYLGTFVKCFFRKVLIPESKQL